MAENDQSSIEYQNPDHHSLAPIETSTALDASSGVDSYAASHRIRSTGSWVDTHLVIPSMLPQDGQPSSAITVRPVSGPLGLHATNPDPDIEPEYVTVPPDVSGYASGYRIANTDFKTNPPGRRKKTFIGGFMKGLGKIPKAVIRGTVGGPRNVPQGRRVQEGSETMGTLPRYVSNPSTPVFVSGPGIGHERNQFSAVPGSSPPESNIPPSLVPGGVQRRRSRPSAAPSIQLTSPRERLSPGSIPPFPQPDLSGSIAPERQIVNDNREPINTTSPHPTRIEVDESQPHISMSSRSRPSGAPGPVPLPEMSHVTGPSLLANPQPTPDYRRMSNTHHTSPVSTMSYEPSFSTELNGPQRFFSTLLAMPWFVSGRITVDYQPGLSRGGWGWKRIAVGVDKDGDVANGGRHEKHRSKTGVGMLYKPVSKPSRSWYTGLPTNNTPARKTNITRWINNVQRDTVDLLSSGGSNSVVRSSAITGTRRSSTVQSPTRERKRRSVVSGQNLYFGPHQYSFLDTSPKMAAKAMRKMQRDAARSKRHPPTRHSSRAHHRSHHDGPHHGPSTSHHATAPMYPHGYVPGPYRPSNAPPVPYSPPPSAAPVYVLQTQPSQPLNAVPSMANMSDQRNSPGTSVGAIPLLSPLYMQVLPAPQPPGDASPPGFAGRGAGGGYVGQNYSHSNSVPAYPVQAYGSPENIPGSYGSGGPSG